MARSLSERAHAAVENLPEIPVRVIDRVFFGFGTAAAAWLAFLLVYQLVEAGWRHIWAFVPFYAILTYLLLPRVHSVLSRLYLPDYFIGRARTREGVLGDPVNLGLRGSREQMHAAMLRAGWRRADELKLFTGWRTVRDTLLRRSYPEAPVSALFLFGQRQAFTYQQEVEGNPAKRHHVRFWPAPKGWRLPGGHKVDWLAAGTFDRSVGLSLFTGQVTHRISPDVDAERDHILATLTSPASENDGVSVKHLRNFSTGYHHRNGGGDRISTDGDLPIVDLRQLEAPSPEIAELIQTDDAEAAYRRPVPITVAFGVGMMLLRVVVGLISITALVGAVETVTKLGLLDGLTQTGIPDDVVVLVARIAVIAYLGAFVGLAAAVYRGRSWARTATLALATVGVIVWAVLWLAGAARLTLLITLVGTAAEILVILALSGETARTYATRDRDAALLARDDV